MICWAAGGDMLVAYRLPGPMLRRCWMMGLQDSSNKVKWSRSHV